MKSILVIGATNVDIIGKTATPLRPEDSNGGRISVHIGGVGKNIAENLKRLTARVEFLTAIGNDAFATIIKNHLDKLGLLYGHSIFCNAPSGVYLAVHGASGDLYVAVSDMETIDAITPEYLITKKDYIDIFDVLVLDANLSKKTLNHICMMHRDKEIVVDAVSTKKSGKIIPILPFVHTLKCNYIEALSMTKGTSFEETVLVFELMMKGIRQVIITNGEKDVFFNEKSLIKNSAVTPMSKIVNANGAGDAFLSGYLYEHARGTNVSEAIETAKKIAAITLMSESACHEALTADWRDLYEKIHHHPSGRSKSVG